MSSAGAMEKGTGARVVLITAPDLEAARRLARGLVEQRLAACVNLVDRLRSVYRWQGEVEEGDEVLMIVKTTTARLEELSLWVVEAHPHDVPECVALEPTAVESRYLSWLIESCAPAPGSPR